MSATGGGGGVVPARRKLDWSIFFPIKKEHALALEKPQDRRQFGRRLVFKAATITHGDGRRVKGTVLNIANGGAQIKVANPELVEAEFYLEIPEDDFIVRCRLVYVEATAIGVQYIKPPRRLSWLAK